MIRFQRISVEVLQANDRGGFGGDRLFAQPATARRCRPIDGDLFVVERAVELVVDLLGKPGHAPCALPGAFLGGNEVVDPLAAVERIGVEARRVQDALTARECFQQLPFGGVAEVGHRELHLAVISHPLVQFVGRHVADFGLVLDHVDRAIALGFKLHVQEVVFLNARHLASVQHQLRLKKRRTVRKSRLGKRGLIVGCECVPVETQQVEALLLVDFELGTGLGLTLGPDIHAAGFGLVAERRRGRLHKGVALLGVLDRAWPVVGRGHQRALPADDAYLAIFVDVFNLLERRAVGHRDAANPVLRHIDLADLKCVRGLVVDQHRRVATRRAQYAIASAHDGAGHVDATRLRLDRLDNDLAGLIVKSAVDRTEACRAQADAGPQIALLVGEIHRAGGLELRSDGELDIVDTALHQAVNVQIARVDIDRAHREHA